MGAVQGHRSGAIASGGHPSPRVLVVDDNRDFAENIAEVVQDLGYSCAVCLTGREALEKTRQGGFDIAVVDLQLPDMYGTRVIAGIKEFNSDCVCIVFTGNATLVNAIEALNRGAFSYLVKGGEVVEFRAILGKAVEAHRNLLELRSVRGLNRTIMENFPGRMALLGDDDRILLTNDYPLPSLPSGGRDGPAGEGRRLEDLFPPERSWCSGVLNAFRDLQDRSHPLVLRRVKDPGGEEGPRHLNIHFIPLHGAEARWLVLVDDVTEVARLERQMEESARLAAMGEMAATIAHEVRNPLSGISGAVQLLQRKFPPGSGEREVCDQVISQVDRLDKTIEDLLVLARPMQPRTVETSMTDLLDSLIQFMRDDPNCRGVEFRRVGEGCRDLVRIDPFLFRHALLNVLINAVQAMGGKGLIELHLECSAERVEVKVRDSGPGFPDDRERLFEAFYTTKPAGTGLGLSITAKILEVHGGSVALRNHPGGGAEVVLSIPRPPGPA